MVDMEDRQTDRLDNSHHTPLFMQSQPGPAPIALVPQTSRCLLATQTRLCHCIHFFTNGEHNKLSISFGECFAASAVCLVVRQGGHESSVLHLYENVLSELTFSACVGVGLVAQISASCISAYVLPAPNDTSTSRLAQRLIALHCLCLPLSDVSSSEEARSLARLDTLA